MTKTTQSRNSRQSDIEELVDLIAKEVRGLNSDIGALRAPAPSARDSDFTAKDQQYDRLRYIQELIDEAMELMDADEEGVGEAERSEATEHELSDLERLAGARSRGGLAIVVGHTRRAPGAVGRFPTGRETEYPWNKDLAFRIQAECGKRGIESKIFYRDRIGVSGAYRNVKAWKPEATVELHFNSASPSARGTETIYGKSASERWATLVQNEMLKVLDRPARLDRGLLLRNERNRVRGWRSVTRVHPSALIEPFFGSSTSESALGAGRKAELALGIVHAFMKLRGMSIDSDAPANDPGQVDGDRPIAGLWGRLRTAYIKSEIEHPDLKEITFAQWGNESGYGTSKLAVEHLNFAGMKWRSMMAPYATKIKYRAHDGLDYYCRFDSLEKFIAGYWARLDGISAYSGWRRYGKDPTGFIRHIGRVWATYADYPDRVIKARDHLVRVGQLPFGAAQPEPGPAPGPQVPQPAPPTPAPDMPSRDRVVAAFPTTAVLFTELFDTYLNHELEFEHQRLATLAQWALESGWGSSELANRHFNFAGIAWMEELDEFAGRYPYAPRETGTVADYCRFDDLSRFIAGYWKRFEVDETYVNWRTAAARSPHDFIDFIAMHRDPGDPSGYARKVKGILGRFGYTRPGRPALVATTSDRASNLIATSAGLRSSVVAMPQHGLVVRVMRTHVERVAGGSTYRTAANYELYNDGQRISDIAGMIFERRGPGDNSARARKFQRRLANGLYPLAAHPAADRYKQDDGSLPALRLMNTGARRGIFLQPGADHSSVTACLNVAAPIDRPGAAIRYDSGLSQLTALIRRLLDLHPDFPIASQSEISNCWLLIEGEPDDVSNHSAARNWLGRPGPTSSRLDARQFFAQDIHIDQLRQAARFDVVASTMNGDGLVEGVNLEFFNALVQQGIDLTQLRGDFGANMWHEWASGWQAMVNGDQREVRERQADNLERIGARLLEALDINDPYGLLPPMVGAAIADEDGAILKLKEWGGDPNLPDALGRSPLVAAASYGAPDAVQALLAVGADRHAVQRQPSTDRLRQSAIKLSHQVQPNVCQPGATPIECAEIGRDLVAGDASAELAYDRVIELLSR